MRNLLWEYTVQTWQMPCLKNHRAEGAVFAFLRKNGYECYESQVPDRYFSNINDPEMYSKIQNYSNVIEKIKLLFAKM